MPIIGSGLKKLGGLGANTIPITYLLRDEFTSGNTTTPRTMTPGPGAWTVTNSANASVSGSQLTETAQFKLEKTATMPRAGGLAFSGRRYSSTGGAYHYLSTASSGLFTHGVFHGNGAAISAKDDNTDISLTKTVAIFGASAEYLVVARPSGGFFLFGATSGYGRWNLLYVSSSNSTATLWANSWAAGGNVGWTKSLRAVALGGAYSSQFGLALDYAATPTSPRTYTATTKDVYAELTWTPVAAETLIIKFRQLDANNYYFLECDQAGSTIKIRTVTAGGAPATVLSSGFTWTAATPFRVHLRVVDGVMQAFVDKTLKLALSAQTTFDNAVDIAVSGFTTATDWAVYPARPTIPAPYAASNYRWLLAYGDSKTADGNYQGVLLDNLETATGARWNHITLARSGFTTAQMKALIDADLLIDWGATPEYILINLGANDVVSMPSQATYEANLGYICDAFHTKWSSVPMFITSPWRRGYATECDTLHTRNGNVIAARSSYCFRGDDERGWMENGDNGVTYTSDGIHPNNAGYGVAATQKQTAMGL